MEIGNDCTTNTRKYLKVVFYNKPAGHRTWDHQIWRHRVNWCARSHDHEDLREKRNIDVVNVFVHLKEINSLGLVNILKIGLYSESNFHHSPGNRLQVCFHL